MRSPLRLAWLSTTFVAVAAVVLTAQSAPAFRTFSVARDSWIDFEPMLDDLAKTDVVLISEEHDDAAGHEVEQQILEGIGKRRESVVLSLEMFERDVQQPLDHFSMGHIDEAAFLKARSWPDYATDWKPLVDLAVDSAS